MEVTVDTSESVRTCEEPTSARLDLDDLSRMDVLALDGLYRKGTCPDRLDVLNGHPRGRMLAIRSLDRGGVADTLRSFARSDGFPWGGKSFSGAGEYGTGINRVHLGGRHQLFPFLTCFRPSVIDGAPCVMLDYDLPDNPWFIRAIHDEVREASPGLFLGPAMWRSHTGHAFVLWFALDTRVQAEAIGAPTARG